MNSWSLYTTPKLVIREIQCSGEPTVRAVPPLCAGVVVFIFMWICNMKLSCHVVLFFIVFKEEYITISHFIFRVWNLNAILWCWKHLKVHWMLRRGILSYVHSDLLTFQKERETSVGFPPSGLSSIALNFTQFKNWFIYMMFKFSNKKIFPKNIYLFSQRYLCYCKYSLRF